MTTTRKISIRALAKIYGYDESSVRGWRERGMPTDTVPNAQAWIVQNIITPLRDGDTKEQKARQDLRKATHEADLKEIEVFTTTRELIKTEYVVASLTAYLSLVKNQIRTIPIKTYLELFESSDSLELKQRLSTAIDEVLTDIGKFEFELPEEEQDEPEQQGKVASNIEAESESTTTSNETKAE